MLMRLAYRGMAAFKQQVLRLLLRILAVSGALRKLPTGVHPNMQVLYNSRMFSHFALELYRTLLQVPRPTTSVRCSAAATSSTASVSPWSPSPSASSTPTSARESDRCWGHPYTTLPF